MHFSSMWSIDRTLSGATISGQSGPGSDNNEGVLHIPPRSSITETSALDCLESNQRLTLWGVLPFCTEAVGVFLLPLPNNNFTTCLFD